MRGRALPSPSHQKRIALAFLGLLAAAAACQAGETAEPDGEGGSTGTKTTTSTDGGGPSTGSSGQGGNNFTTAMGGNGGEGGTIMNPCGTGCGDEEICGDGLDNNCNNVADELCPCKVGQSLSCFLGDSSYADSEGCFPGTMQCTENAVWGPCVGGAHANEMCFSANPAGCHAISAVPFQTADLRNGTGTFDDNADTEMFAVDCPPGVTPCPAVMGVSDFQALQSGEYTVTYTKTVSGNMDECTFPLFVGARGLRVELTWNYPSGFDTTDLDLHMLQPMSMGSLTSAGGPQDCGFINCKAFNFIDFPSGQEPQWFPPGNMPPDPVNWYDAPNDQEDLCYFAPQGAGAEWAAAGMGCHSPRLDLDNISCDPSVSDPNDFSYCAPENINVDFPPKNEWIRIGVHYYPGTSSFTGTTFPNVKIFCDGKQAAELGAFGFNNPESPVTWSLATAEDQMWIVADVLFREDECTKECIVQPIYANDASKTPLIVSDGAPFAPAYPPIPMP
jgi:hypothetical protein